MLKIPLNVEHAALANGDTFGDSSSGFANVGLHWYLLGAAILIGLSLLVVILYVLKRRQARSDPESRLSAAFREGFLREDSGPKWSFQKSSGSEGHSAAKEDNTVETSFSEDKQQTRRLISQDKSNSGGGGNGGYGGVGKESNALWCQGSDSLQIGGVGRGHGGECERINSPKESKIEIETRGEKSYCTIIERVNQKVDYDSDEGSVGDKTQTERGFIEKCYDEYKSKKDRLTEDDDDDEADLKNAEQEEDEKEDERKAEEAGHLGKLFFEVRYDHERLILSVSVTKAVGLPMVDSILGSSDPYIKLQLLPDKKLKVKTRLIRKSQNPAFDEQFDFYNMEPDQMEKITLHFSVFSFDRFSRDHFIGEVRYPLAEVAGRDGPGDKSESPDDGREKELEVIQRCDGDDRSFSLRLCLDIQPPTLKLGSHSRGELLLSLCYKPASSQLVLTILKAQNLLQSDTPEAFDPCVKIYLKFDGQRLAKKRTASKSSTANPVFNETFTFQLPRTPSELASMIAWNRCNSLASSSSSSNSFTQKFSLPCRFQSQTQHNTESGDQKNLDQKSPGKSSLFRRFSICSSTLLDKPKGVNTIFLPKSPTFSRNSAKRPVHIMDRFSLSIFVVDEEQESCGDFIGRVELGSFLEQEHHESSTNLNNLSIAADHWRDIIANPKKQIAKWYQLTD